jgi:hypothetical protein
MEYVYRSLILSERARWFHKQTSMVMAAASFQALRHAHGLNRQNYLFQRLKDRLLGLRRYCANPSGTPVTTSCARGSVVNLSVCVLAIIVRSGRVT